MYKKLLYILVIVFLMVYIKGFAQSNEYPFKVHKSGSGEKSLIFIPGFGSSDMVWKKSVEMLQDNCTCYTLTMAGFGGTKAVENPSYDYWIKSIADYIVKNDIKKPIVIGHSLGGMMAMSLASLYPNLLSAIVDVDGFPIETDDMNINFKPQKNLDCSPAVEYFNSLDEQQFTEKIKEILRASMVTEEPYLNLATQALLQSDRTTFALIGCQLRNLDLREDLSKITCPALILLNSEVKEKHQAEVAQMFKNLKTADIRYATKGKHLIMYEDPDWFYNQLMILK